jgi:hypothetical protein
MPTPPRRTVGPRRDKKKPQELPTEPKPPKQDLGTLEGRLDEGLEESFPASDPLSVDPPKPKRGRS